MAKVLLGNCIHCGAPCYYDPDEERFFAESEDPDCLCEVENQEEKLAKLG